jgi:hypothetical protein
VSLADKETQTAAGESLPGAISTIARQVTLGKDESQEGVPTERIKVNKFVDSVAKRRDSMNRKLREQ